MYFKCLKDMREWCRKKYYTKSDQNIFPKDGRNINFQNQKPQLIIRRINVGGNVDRHMAVKLLEDKDK